MMNRMIGFRIGTVLGMALGLLTTAAAAQALPNLNLTLKPHVSGKLVDYVDITLAVQRPETKAGAPLLHMALEVASIPTVRYDGDAVSATDAEGMLALTQKDGERGPFGIGRDWLAARDTAGDVTYRYRAVPRTVSSATRAGPLFDLRAEAGGLNGAGLAFLALPPEATKYHISLHWDLSGMPAGARGVWSVGEGDVATEGTAQLLADSYYAAGPLQSYPANPDGNFGMYWLSDTPYDMREVGQYIQTLYAYMADFFHDTHGSYRILVRKNPYRGANGTALTKSFMFSFSDGLTQTTRQLKDLLSHEMTHNWPSLEGRPGDTSWYAEGTAEYYSGLLSLRAGAISPQELLERVNERAVAYYTNPLQRLTNRQAEEIYWQDTRAQRVPYGRGFMYLAKVDAEIRAKSNGRRSLDDIAKELYRREATGKPYGIAAWLELVSRELGAQAKPEYDDMAAGKPIVPPSSALATCFTSVKKSLPEFELGFSEASFRGSPRIIQGLVAGSAAAKAGVLDGDEVLDFTNVSDLLFHVTQHMNLKIRRQGKIMTFDYLPRGRMVDGYLWELTDPQPAPGCHV
jgi:predicted metalloprotease with PDZ domain